MSEVEDRPDDLTEIKKTKSTDATKTLGNSWTW